MYILLIAEVKVKPETKDIKNLILKKYCSIQGVFKEIRD